MKHVSASVERYADNTITFTYSVTWNDMIDKNERYKSDRIKNKIAEFISAGKCEAYKIEVNWNDKFTIGPEGAKFGE